MGFKKINKKQKGANVAFIPFPVVYLKHSGLHLQFFPKVLYYAYTLNFIATVLLKVAHHNIV